MNAQPFTFPMRHLPFPNDEDWSAFPAPLLLFKAQGTDKGLANATRFYWLAKRVTLVVSMSVQDKGWIESDPPTDPATYTLQTRSFSYEKTYTAYATDPDATSTFPTPSTAEETWGLPHERGWALEEFPASAGGGNLRVSGLSNSFQVGDAGNFTGGTISFSAVRIEFNAVHDRWCLAVGGSCGITGEDFTGDVLFDVSTTAYLEESDYILGSGEAMGTVIVPDIFESSPLPKLVYGQPTRYNPGTFAMEDLATSVSYEFQVDYWNIPT